jgi:hypothetical protein
MATKHKLKYERKYYEAARKQTKTFVFRKNDRQFKVGDVVILSEVVNAVYTGRELPPRKIHCIFNGEKYCILQLNVLPTL